MRSVGVPRIVFSSTTATYGTPETMPITESLPLQPINPYGFSKRVVEQMLTDYSAAYGFSFAALRYFNAAGASPDGDLGEDHHPESHLIPIVLQVALGQREHITIFGDDYPTPDGTCIRDYVHVDDLASAHQAALEKLCGSKEQAQSESPHNLRMNLGIGRGYSVKEVIDVCRQVTEHEIPSIIGPRRPGDPPELVADSSLARRELDWRPKYNSLESIVQTAWNWHSQHPTGFAQEKKLAAKTS
jgi:UDP-glucose 4-epimerase